MLKQITKSVPIQIHSTCSCLSHGSVHNNHFDESTIHLEVQTFSQAEIAMILDAVTQNWTAIADNS
jgi:hypothetical protein